MAYEITYKILSADCDMHRRLRLSRLFIMLQEAAIAHTEALGFGREKTLDRGYLWIVSLQHVKLQRLPEYDEHITLRSVPGEMMHTFFPRFYQITDETGTELATAAAFWALMDAEKRKMLFPEDAGVEIAGEPADWAAYMPRAPKLPAGGEETVFTVPYSYADLNGHMNNSRYFDLAEDCMPPALRDAKVREIMSEYTAEARPGECFTITKSIADGNTFLFSGAAEKRLFRIGIRYEV